MEFSICESPLEEINSRLFSEKKVKVYLKRDDLIHPIVEGNKFRKLKYNLQEVLNGSFNLIETFGGAYSNHILAVSQAGKLLNIKTRAYINALYADPKNYTLRSCAENGMELIFLDKSQFRERLEKGRGEGENSYFLPEGGSNEMALKGSAEIMEELSIQLPEVTHIICPLGTGGTISGMVTGNKKEIKIIAVPVLKMDTLNHLQNKFPKINFDQLEIWNSYHFGGYAKIDDELITFIKNCFDETGIVIDPIYNGKALFGLMDKIKHDHFPIDSQIVYVHTGGSQGIYGMNERFGLDLPVKDF